MWRSYQYSLKVKRRKIDRYPIAPSDEGTYEWLEGQMALLISTTMVSCGKGWQRRGKSGAILPLIWGVTVASRLASCQSSPATCLLACILTPEGREASLTLYEYGRIKQPLHELSGLWMAWGPWGAPAINTLCTTNIATLAAIISTWIALPHQNAINLYLSVLEQMQDRNSSIFCSEFNARGVPSSKIGCYLLRDWLVACSPDWL